MKTTDELLAELICIPSVNPGHSKDERITGELHVAEFCADYLSALGFQLAWQDKESGRPNLIANLGNEDARHRLLFESHLDTVGIEGMTRTPFDPVMEAGRMYGRGACDAKGPLAAFLSAITRVDRGVILESGLSVCFVGAMGEEEGNEGAFRIVEGRQLWADEAVILEPTELRIIHAHKGVLWFTLTVYGRAAHGSNPEKGCNAISGMAQVIRDIEAFMAEKLRSETHPSLGHPTLSLGRIRGGQAVNVVADSCSLDIDRRVLPGESFEAILNEIRGIAQQRVDAGDIIGYEIDVREQRQPFHAEPSVPLVRRLGSVCEDLGLPGEPLGAAWYSDAGAFSAICGSTVVFGPGSIKQAHTEDEYIELDSLEAGTLILRRFLEQTVADISDSDKETIS